MPSVLPTDRKSTNSVQNQILENINNMHLRLQKNASVELHRFIQNCIFYAELHEKKALIASTFIDQHGLMLLFFP